MLQLNLNDLTAEHLAQARPFCGEQCLYAAPCIIGTLVPKTHRRTLDHYGDESDTSVGYLASEEVLKFADAEQELDAVRMQEAFDEGRWSDVVEIAKPYVNA